MSFDMELGTITIAALYWESFASFNRLLENFEESQNTPDTLSDDFGRLKVWAENVAAHRRGVMSLDYRLREASEVSERVKQLLKDLNDVLEDTLIISSDDPEAEDNAQNTVETRSTGPHAFDAMDSDIDDEIRATSPLKEAVKEIGNVITCLYRLSITVQSPASVNRLERMERIDVSHFERFDIDYVSNKFTLSEDYRYLIERLGKANTKRRQLLKYHDEHHEKIVGRRPTVDDKNDGESLDGQDDFYSEAPTDMRTTVSTVYQTNFELVEAVPMDSLDSRSEAGFSATSYASSAATSGSLRVPAPPPGFDTGPFQCPYCFIIVETESHVSWKKHVFQDLRPYVCTFKDCPQASHLYQSRHEWFAHERDMHRREWFCSKCKKTHPSSDQFQKHLVKKHKNAISGSKEQLEVLIARGARVIEEKEKCPLCQEKHAPNQLRSHLGRHLEQISLFILPQDSKGDVDNSSDHNSDDDDIEATPDTKSKTSSIVQRVREGYLTAQMYFKAGTGINDFDKNGWAPIHKAAKSGDVQWATLLLESGCDPRDTTKGVDKMQPLHIAAKAGHVEVATILLKQPTVEINAKDGVFGKTAFAWACQYGHENIAKLLLQRKDVDINLKDNHEQTVLLWACKEGRESIVKLLLSREDAEVNVRDSKWGESALNWACQNGRQDVVKLLLARSDIEINAKDDGGNTPVLWACRNGHADVVKLLLARDDVDSHAKNNHGRTPFVWAWRNGHEDIMKLLLSQDDVEVNAKDNDGKTAFVWSCENGHEAIVKLLLARDDVEINAKDNDGKTAFFWACQNGREEVVKLLLCREDVKVDTKDNDGKTAFVCSCENGREAIVKLLLARDDVEVNVKDEDGRTVFAWACEKGHGDVVKLLLARGDVGVNAKDNDGRTVLAWACEKGHEDFVKPLLTRDDVEVNEQDNDGRAEFIWAREKGHEEFVKLLLAQDDVEVNAKDNHGKTELVWAYRNGHEGLVKLLLSGEDIEINSKNNDGRTVLIWACEKGYGDVVGLLLARDDVEVNAKDKYDRTALIWACQNGHEGLVKRLLSRDDIEINIKDTQWGGSALLWASENGHAGVVKLLLSRNDIDANAKDKDGHTALDLARRYYHHNIAEQIYQFVNTREIV